MSPLDTPPISVELILDDEDETRIGSVAMWSAPREGELLWLGITGGPSSYRVTLVAHHVSLTAIHHTVVAYVEPVN